MWGKEHDQAFNKIKQTLVKAPALGIPDLNKPAFLYTAEKQGVALGVLVQWLGNKPRLVAYFSKKLDNVATG